MGRGFLTLVLGSLIVSGCAPKNDDPVRPVAINAKGDLLAPTAGSVENWFTKDPKLDGVEGVSAERAYNELGVKVGVKPVIVAVIDSGVDIEHEDLKAHIWTNPGESGLDKNGNDKATNGIDDDGNGYIDDVHGWNFLGSYDADHKPVNLVHTTLEVTRELVKMRKLKTDADAGGVKLTPDQEAYLVILEKDFGAQKNDATESLALNMQLKNDLQVQYDILKPVLNVAFDDLTLVAVKAVQSTDTDIQGAATKAIKLFEDNHEASVARINRLITRENSTLSFYLNDKDADPRSVVIKDNPNDFSDHNYGNNDVRGSDGEHGSHVSGIIGAIRGNGIGIDGVATDVQIMSVRAVPDGDEADKDIYNAVRYAVDNGAQILNMSFGKAYSPGKSKVDEAFKYAADHGVLIVHAAGNDGVNTETASNFPNRHALSGGEIPNWIEVGASSSLKGLILPAFFSNYGKNSVDIFAPGVAIKSTVPDKNQYAVFSGTSMASPTTAGVAALVLSQHPEMKGADLRALLLSTARLYGDLQVNQPSTTIAPVLVSFDSLSKTGGIADVFAALKKAAGM